MHRPGHVGSARRRQLCGLTTTADGGCAHPASGVALRRRHQRRTFGGQRPFLRRRIGRVCGNHHAVEAGSDSWGTSESGFSPACEHQAKSVR
ncbi:hypothetical protein HYPSUDRAFT_409393 [Hypholoma sublateritium FD-334 SS-4]|uniref:Uncharacterized protein n=1 Tax=Hypholoma sublateritium (strain FD-334 SS-4) TaxID=945553 RepID=A0A0D2PAL6_HYPSF|nr:hypothetical protein HYPSUDRAFT_409393 [Hypholoma sublateritium FD-334 SS-4]